MRVTYSPRAVTDLEGIADYLLPRNPQAALRVRTTILNTLQHLVRHPRLGRQQSAEGVRKIVTRKYSYRIYYTVEESADAIVVVTIQHGSQQAEFTDA